ncbi:uncharacterized protein BDZ99DRAFT_412734, partial [Mytilinidion resinicola]
MARIFSFPIIILALLITSSTASVCGTTDYDPSKYVCWYSSFLCPYTNGSPLSYCNGACYSPFMYHCTNGTLYLNTITTLPVSLTISNPTIPELNGYPVRACSQKFNTGYYGQTCTYCPKDVVPKCPNSTTTVVYPEGGLDVVVPGGQRWYVDPSGALGFTQAHSAYIPPGSQVDGFQAYESGALVNLKSPWGWVAC